MTSFYLSTPYQPPQAPIKLPLDERPGPCLAALAQISSWRVIGIKNPYSCAGLFPLLSSLSSKELLKFALREEVESRLVKSKPWSLTSGPFSQQTIPAIDKPHWTMLFQGMEAHHPAAAKILSWFRFIPDARLDDLMVSIAGVGGGVGPHFDSYDVFLIQMSGRRRWKISEQQDLSLNPKLPLKILQNLNLEQEWVLELGDMLYLPPHVAHDGIALDAGCQTWSVGFRSPSFKELLQEGLWRLAESLENIPALEKKFADPKQGATHFTGQLPAELIKQLSSKLKELKLDRIDGFLPGISAYLSEPKQQAIFNPPEPQFSPVEFENILKTRMLVPHPQTRILSLGKQVYCNGENMSKEQLPDIVRAWQTLSAKKQLGASNLKNLENSTLFEAYLAGWLVLQD